MVWGKLFGGGNKGGGRTPTPEELARRNHFLNSLDPAWREAYQTIHADPDVDKAFKDHIYASLHKGEIEEARKTVRAILLDMSPAQQERVKYAGQHGAWASFEDLLYEDILTAKGNRDPMDSIVIGRVPLGDDGNMARALFHGQGHLLTVAPTGAGKGQHYVIPTLLDFEGPVVVLDPKGENYEETAWRRNLYGQVFKWAPGHEDSDCYNPLDAVKGWDDARILAELLIEPQSKEPFWDSAAKDLLTGLIFYVIRSRPAHRRNMREVCRLLASSKADHEDMIETLKGADEERLRELGNTLESQSENLQASIATTLRTQLEAWRTDDIVATTSTTTPGWTVEEILVRDNMGVTFAAMSDRLPGWHSPAPGHVERGSSGSVFLIVPPEKIGAYKSVLRVMLGQHLAEAIKWRAVIDKDNKEDDSLPDSYPDFPMMFYLDELPQLGYMRIVEDAVAITRSFRVRLWLFTQDMAQLKEVYPKWESLLANCRCQIYFRPNDLGTAEHVANRLGQRKDIWGGEDWIASPQKLMGKEFRDKAVIFMDGFMIKSELGEPAYRNEDLQEWIAEQKQDFGDTVTRAPRPEAPPPEPEPEEDEPLATTDNGGAGSAASQKETGLDGETDDLSDDPEYQAELAALQARMRARKAETSNKPPERPVESSDTDKRPPTPPDFND